jgi:phage shock protein A
MADIDIQKKERGPWGWIIGLLALVLIIWGITEVVGRDDADLATITDPVEEGLVTPAAEQVGEPAASTPGARLDAWMRDSAEALDAMGRQHEYTREGISRIAAAIENLVARDTAPAMQQHVRTMRQQVSALESSDPSSRDHAGQAKQAFVSAVDALEELAQRPHLGGADLDQPLEAARSAAESMAADTPLLEQRARVHEFFSRMSDAITRAERQHLVR